MLLPGVREQTDHELITARAGAKWAAPAQALRWESVSSVASNERMGIGKIAALASYLLRAQRL